MRSDPFVTEVNRRFPRRASATNLTYPSERRRSLGWFLWYVLAAAIVVLLLALAGHAQSLKVTSFPSGANVSIDGTDTGKTTPMTVGLSLGNHTVVVSVAGATWQPSTTIFNVADTGVHDLSVSLLPPLPPKGDKGDPGPIGPAGPISVAPIQVVNNPIPVPSPPIQLVVQSVVGPPGPPGQSIVGPPGPAGLGLTPQPPMTWIGSTAHTNPPSWQPNAAITVNPTTAGSLAFVIVGGEMDTTGGQCYLAPGLSGATTMAPDYLHSFGLFNANLTPIPTFNTAISAVVSGNSPAFGLAAGSRILLVTLNAGATTITLYSEAVGADCQNRQSELIVVPFF